MPSTNDFDPVAMFPARVRKKIVRANAAEKGTAVRGHYNHETNSVGIPLANTAYDRTVRLHETLHALYTDRKPDGKNLSNGLEDARLHLNYAKTEGTVRRDELATALKDLHVSKRVWDLRLLPKDLAAILSLRAAAILDRSTTWSIHKKDLRAVKALRRMAEYVHPKYPDAIARAINWLHEENWDAAKTELLPYFVESSPITQPFPKAGMGGGGNAPESKFADVSFAKLEGKITAEAAELLGKRYTDEIAGMETPKLNIHRLFANYSIPTFFGETEKHKMCGSKIDPKKLALVVGPTTPHIFRDTIHRNGGTVVIDSSGSMGIGAEQLLQLLTAAPLATIAFYNAPHDAAMVGNMWIFSHKGKRAIDLRDVPNPNALYEKCCPNHEGDGTPQYTEFLRQYGEIHKTEDYYGGGNVVDFQVIQWLLAQPGPRYILTDGEFTGPTAGFGKALLRAAIARKKLKQITSVAEMEQTLLAGVEGVTK